MSFRPVRTLREARMMVAGQDMRAGELVSVPVEQPQYVINWNATTPDRSAWAELQKHMGEAIVQACALPPGYQYVSVGYREERQATEGSMYEPKVGDLVTNGGSSKNELGPCPAGMTDAFATVLRVVDGFDGGGGYIRGCSFRDGSWKPMRPTAVGQRVRGRHGTGTVTSVKEEAGYKGRIEIQWDAPSVRSMSFLDELIRISDKPTESPKAVHPSEWKPGDLIRHKSGSSWRLLRLLTRKQNQWTVESVTNRTAAGAVLDIWQDAYEYIGPETIPSAAPTFKVGDRVQYTEACCEGFREVGEVLDVVDSGGQLHVRWRAGGLTLLSEAHTVQHAVPPTAISSPTTSSHSVKEAAVSYKPTIGIPETPPSKPLHPCHHCGAETIRGLLADTCPNGHDLTMAKAEPEPTVHEAWGYGGLAGHAAMAHERGAERHYVVFEKRGAATFGHRHPTREGAIAAWREAVKR